MAMVDPFPQDIVEDILSRLPVKSLQRLRCMSKSTDSLISARSFAMMHIKRTSSKKIFLASKSNDLMSFDYKKENAFGDDIEGAISSLDFPPKTHGSYTNLTIVGSCHGLLCLKFHDDFYVWNPSTQHYTKLPDLPSGSGNSLLYGFGYDSFSDDYKLIYWNGYNIDKAYILSLRENRWRNIKIPPSFAPHFMTILRGRRGSFINGTLNWIWIVMKEPITHLLLAFDLKTENFFELPMPDVRPDNRDTGYLPCGLEVFEGRLCLVVRINYNHVNELWIMNEYGVRQSWIRLPDASFHAVYSDIYVHSPLCISKDNQIILLCKRMGLTRLDAQERELVEFGPVCKCEGHNSSLYFYRCRQPRDGVVYLESLVSPNGRPRRKNNIGVNHNQNQIWHGTRQRQPKKKFQYMILLLCLFVLIRFVLYVSN